MQKHTHTHQYTFCVLKFVYLVHWKILWTSRQDQNYNCLKQQICVLFFNFIVACWVFVRVSCSSMPLHLQCEHTHSITFFSHLAGKKWGHEKLCWHSIPVLQLNTNKWLAFYFYGHSITLYFSVRIHFCMRSYASNSLCELSSQWDFEQQQNMTIFLHIHTILHQFSRLIKLFSQKRECFFWLMQD